jgi:hypothetical protein
MKIEEFYKAYANLPISSKQIMLDMSHETMLDIFKEVESLEAAIFPLRVWQNELLERAEKGFKALEAARDKTF